MDKTTRTLLMFGGAVVVAAAAHEVAVRSGADLGLAPIAVTALLVATGMALPKVLSELA